MLVVTLLAKFLIDELHKKKTPPGSMPLYPFRLLTSQATLGKPRDEVQRMWALPSFTTFK